MKPFASGLTRFSQRERDQCAAFRNEQIKRGIARRKSTPSGQFYNVPGTPESKARDNRRMGEKP
jgi:hypothetical protein